MSKPKPTIETAWAAFESDLVLNGCTRVELDFFKLVWHGGAMAMGIVLTSRETALDEKVHAFDAVASFLASKPNFARLAVRLAEIRRAKEARTS